MTRNEGKKECPNDGRSGRSDGTKDRQAVEFTAARGTRFFYEKCVQLPCKSDYIV